MFDIETLSLLGNLINLGVLGVTLGVALFGVYQFRASQHLSRSQAAKEIYAQYLRFAFENPRFADPALARLDVVGKSFDDSPIDFARYEWFVSSMIMAYEEIHVLSSEPAWSRTMKDNLSYHRAYFASAHFRDSGYLTHIDEPLASLIRDVAAGK